MSQETTSEIIDGHSLTILIIQTHINKTTLMVDYFIITIIITVVIITIIIETFFNNNLKLI